MPLLAIGPACGDQYCVSVITALLLRRNVGWGRQLHNLLDCTVFNGNIIITVAYRIRRKVNALFVPCARMYTFLLRPRRTDEEGKAQCRMHSFRH
jgi:hypothetical protein